MAITIRGNTEQLRRPSSFLVSLCVHGAVLGYVIVGAATQSATLRPIYDQEIRPFEHKLIWYSLKNRVPDVRPAAPSKTSRPPRAVRKFDQSLIAGKKDDPKPLQKVWVPDPPKVDLAKAKVEPLPNLLAAAPAPKRPVRKFEPPPTVARKVKPTAQLPDAPEVAMKSAAPVLKDLPIESNLPRPVRIFLPPPAVKVAAKSAPTELPAPPEAQIAAPVSAATMAIVGLDPAKTMNVPKPPAPHDANFSAGPKPNPNGESAPESKAMLSVPGLYAHGGPKDARATLMSGLAPLSQQNLMAAMHPGNAAPRTAAAGPHAPRVSSSPDPRMDGRAIYMMAIQMQNITSYSGSWMVWFAEHQALPGGPPAVMRPPDPLHKVDPKYIADAVLERVEGTVRLSAVIRKDGRVDTVELLKHLDDRLDKSAEEALAKWQFEPAVRDGTPVDVDAVFEIPFRLAPKIAK